MRALESSSQLADPASIWLADTPTLADDDPMAQVLPWLVSHLGMAETLAEESGLDDAACRARPGRLLHSLQQLGFDTRLSHDPVTALRADDLPAVLRLRSGDACVLTALQGRAGAPRRCQVVVLAPEPMAFTVTDADLARECAGPALLVRQPATPVALVPVAPVAARVATPPPAASPWVDAEPPLAIVEPPAVIVEPPPVIAEPAAVIAEPPSALSQALAARRNAMAQAAEVRRAAAPPERVAPAGQITLPTLDDVIAPDELASLAHLAAQPGRVAAWVRSVPSDPVLRQTPARPATAVPAMPQPLPPPPDGGPDVVLDLGFLDRQTGAGRLRGRVDQWQRQLRGRLQGLAGLDGPGTPQALGALGRLAHIGAHMGGAPASAQARQGRTGASPRRTGWRPPFGLGWPLGHAPSDAGAANAANAAVTASAVKSAPHGPPQQRREPTLAAVPAVAKAMLNPVTPRKAPAFPAGNTGGRRDEAWPESLSAVWSDAPPGAAPPGRPPGAGPQRAPDRTRWPGVLAWRRGAIAAAGTAGVAGAAGMAVAGRAVQAWAGRWRSRVAGCSRWPQWLADRSGLPDLAAALDRWRRSPRLERWLQGPLLAACSAVCLLDGLPLAWARMASISGLKAAGSVLPGLMRQALAADQERAVAVLAGDAVAPGPMAATSRSRAPVPAAANSPRLVATALAAGSAPARSGGAGGGLGGPSTLAMVAARAEKAQRARERGVDVATTLRRRSEAMSMGPPVPARPRRALTAGMALMAA